MKPRIPADVRKLIQHIIDSAPRWALAENAIEDAKKALGLMRGEPDWTVLAETIGMMDEVGGPLESDDDRYSDRIDYACEWLESQ